MEVTSERENQGRGRLSTPVLIGRVSELRRLVEIAGRSPAVILVEGEAGIGKSRLVREMAHHPELGGRRVLIGHCHRMREPFPLEPIIDALRGAGTEPPVQPLTRVAGALRPLLPELAAKLPPPPDPLADAGAERYRVFRALRELFGALGPTVCILEDLQWADDGTLELLSFLVTELPRQLSLVLTYSDEHLRPSALETLAVRAPDATTSATVSLRRLSVEDAGRMAGAILSVPDVSEEFAVSLHRKTAGIPFVIEELVCLLRDRTDLATLDGVHQDALDCVGMPPAVRYDTLARLQGLRDDAQLAARAAAVLGRPAPEELLRKVAGSSPGRGAQAIGEALTATLLEQKGDGLYGLRHPLAAQAIYEDTPPPDRARLHLRAARALEARPEPRPLAQLAHHFKEANRRRQWFRCAEAAADAATAVGDDLSAVRILEDTLAAADLPRATRIRMALKLGPAALYARRPADAIPILERIVDDDRLQPGLRGELRLCLAKLLIEVRSAGSKRQLRQAADELGRRPRLAASAVATLARRETIAGAGKGKLRWLEQAIEAAGRQDDPAARTEVLWTRASVLLSLGDPAGWRALDELPWSEHSNESRLELVRACKYLAQSAMSLGHYGRAQSLIEEAERIRDELGSERFAFGLATTKAALDWRAGRWEGLESRARRLMETTTEAVGFYPANGLTLGRLQLARGELAAAERTFASVGSVPPEAKKPQALRQGAAELAVIELARDNAQRACELATTGLDKLDGAVLWASAQVIMPVAVEALIAGGDRRQASELVERVGRGLKGRDAPGPKLALEFARGLVAEAEGRPDPALSCFKRAERGWRRLHVPYSAAGAREHRGRALLAAGEASGGDCLIGALGEFHGLGAAWDAARVRAELRRRHVTVPYPLRGGRRRYRGELSPREDEVARLTRIGWTTREIGRALFLSPRTVEKHLASAKKKLGLQGRRTLQPIGAPKIGGPPP